MIKTVTLTKVSKNMWKDEYGYLYVDDGSAVMTKKRKKSLPDFELSKEQLLSATIVDNVITLATGERIEL